MPAAPFHLHLDNFEGPFDLLLSLISKHKLDITEVSLSRVTDEFIAHVKALGGVWDLEQTSSFLVVAATLLDLKASRLLPKSEVEDEEDLALLEARDLLFARLLQYRAFKDVAAVFEDRLAQEAKRFPRAVGLEERYATLLPEVLIGLGLEEFASLAATAMTPKPVPEVSFAHLHAPQVSVREQGALVMERLRTQGTMTFRALCGDAPDTLTKVARFLSLLELFREGAVAFDQVTPLGELTVRWTAEDEADFEIGDEFDGDAPDAPTTPDEPLVPTSRRPARRPARPPDRGGRPAVNEQIPEARATQEEGEEMLVVPLVDLRPALEALLMVADQPMDDLTLAAAVGHPADEVAAALEALSAEYAEQGRGFDLRSVAGGWRFYTRDEYASVVERYVRDGQQARLTQAALETLAVVAYKQPVSRARVSAVRGVNVDGVIRTLVSRGLVEETGQDSETTAVLYGTTSYFLERLGIIDLGELPDLAPFLPDLEDMDEIDGADPVVALVVPDDARSVTGSELVGPPQA